ncbi:MAG TPA: hypothetical protein VH834_18035 [Solirubrobacteraceae bacterium]
MSAEPELALIPDAERLVSAYLRERPRMQALVGERIYTAFPAQAGEGALLLIQRVGGEPPLSHPLVVDAAELQLDAYGGPKVLAYELAATARAELAVLEGQVRPEGNVSAVRFGALRWLPDDTYDQPRPRYLLDVTLTVSAAKTAARALAATR